MLRLKQAGEEISDLKTLYSLASTLKEVSTDVGLSHMSFFYVLPPFANNQPVNLITSCGEAWVQRYFMQGYDRIDPVLKMGRNCMLPINWTQFCISSRDELQLFSESAAFGVGECGLTIPIRGVGLDLGLFSVSANESEASWRKTVRSLESELLLLAVKLYNHIFRTILRNTAGTIAVLSPREKQALFWAAHGKTAWETGKILNLSERTVAFYIKNACEKLQVWSKTHAVAIFVSQWDMDRVIADNSVPEPE